MSVAQHSCGSRTGKGKSSTTPMPAGRSKMASTQAIEDQPFAVAVARPEIADIERARSCRAELAVDHAAIHHNVGVIGRLAAGSRIIGVIKGDAYGLGAVEVARTLQAAQVPAFAV